MQSIVTVFLNSTSNSVFVARFFQNYVSSLASTYCICCSYKSILFNFHKHEKKFAETTLSKKLIIFTGTVFIF